MPLNCLGYNNFIHQLATTSDRSRTVCNWNGAWKTRETDTRDLASDVIHFLWWERRSARGSGKSVPCFVVSWAVLFSTAPTMRGFEEIQREIRPREETKKHCKILRLFIAWSWAITEKIKLLHSHTALGSIGSQVESSAKCLRGYAVGSLISVILEVPCCSEYTPLRFA